MTTILASIIAYIVWRYSVLIYKGGMIPLNPQLNAALTEAVYYILLSVISPLHGYGIMQKIEELSHGKVKLAAGTLYGAISTMLEK